MALIPPAFLNSVVALGGSSQDGEIRYTATGFLYGYPSGRSDADGAKLYWIFLVTNRHVFQKAFDRNAVLQARFNRPIGAGANVYPIPVQEPDGSPAWTVHPDSDVDVAVLRISPNRLKQDGVEYSFFAFGFIRRLPSNKLRRTRSAKEMVFSSLDFRLEKLEVIGTMQSCDKES